MKASEYHLRTSYDRMKMSGRGLDWANQPEPCKRYPGVRTISLPGGLKPPGVLLSTLLDPGRSASEVPTITLEELSLLLLLTLTITARSGDYFFRSAASAGALYPSELYVAARGVKGLEDGLYHFNLPDHSLTPLAQGDASREPPARTEGEDEPLLTFVVTAVYHRSAWKYGNRSYRYDLLDSGHLLENLTLALKTLGRRFVLSCDFDDHAVNRVLGLDEGSEGALALVHVGRGRGTALPERPGTPQAPDPSPASRKIVGDHPLVLGIHRAGIGPFPEELAESEGVAPPCPAGSHDIEETVVWPEVMDYPEALYRRRSKRNFAGQPIGREGVLALLSAVHPLDPEEKRALRHVRTGFALGAGEHMDPGFCLLAPGGRSAGRTRGGPLMRQIAEACLDQLWLSNAGIHFVFAADLAHIDRSGSARGYRHAMLNAGRIGQRLYLAATALGLGCCGIGAFYDRELADLLGLESRLSVLYLVAVGRVKGRRT